jgi:predicted nuclease with TOPRIM domain
MANKINFTKDHYTKMCNGLLSMLLDNETVATKMGTPLNAIELLHTTTVGTLNNIRVNIGKQIESLEDQDEWVSTSASQNKLNKLKSLKETINLIIGYKRHKMEVEETKREREELNRKLAELKESTKKPEDKIKELEAKLADLDTTEF